MSSLYQQFKKLHYAAEPLLLPNAWDAKSALQFQENGSAAIGTSSAAVAASLGYEDGGKMPFEDYLFVIKRIIAAVKVPVTIDLEMGYGTTAAAVFKNIQTLTDLGVAGINIEDSLVNEAGRNLQDSNVFAQKLEAIKNKLLAANIDLFVNVRCDTYLLSVAYKQEETERRAKLYEAAGADGLFLPCITAMDDISKAVKNTTLPLNVMCIPGLPGFDSLQDIGVKRISMGPFFFNKVYDQVKLLSTAIEKDKNFSAILK